MYVTVLALNKLKKNFINWESHIKNSIHTLYNIYFFKLFIFC